MAINYREQYARYTRYFQNLKQLYDKKPEVRASLELLLTLLTVSFFAIFAIRPTLNTISELISSIKSQEEISEKLDTKIAQLNQAKNSWNKEEKRFFLLDQSLPIESEPNNYLRQLEALTSKYGLTFTALNVEEVLLFGRETTTPEDLKNSSKNVRVSFSVSGQYQPLASYLEELESLRRIIKISSVSFGAGKGKQTGSLVLTITGDLPYYPKQ